MTRAEVTEIFAVLMMAYPNAEMFKAPDKDSLKAKLAPTITLWTTCLRDIDFWAAQQAVHPGVPDLQIPSDHRGDAGGGGGRSARGQVGNQQRLPDGPQRTATGRLAGRTKEQALEGMPTRTQKVIEAMGGIDAFMPPDKKYFEMERFEQTYETMLRKNPIGLPGSTAGQRQITE